MASSSATEMKTIVRGQEFQKLRLLKEENRRQLALIAEVQTHHGKVLQQISEDIEPLKVLPGLLQHVVRDHERRISALELRAGAP